MAEGATIAGLSVATITLIISVICFVWLIGHMIHNFRNNGGMGGIFKGGKYSGTEFM